MDRHQTLARSRHTDHLWRFEDRLADLDDQTRPFTGLLCFWRRYFCNPASIEHASLYPTGYGIAAPKPNKCPGSAGFITMGLFVELFYQCGPFFNRGNRGIKVTNFSSEHDQISKSFRSNYSRFSLCQFDVLLRGSEVHAALLMLSMVQSVVLKLISRAAASCIVGRVVVYEDESRSNC